jgi:non-ribosomal peptide synthetase-like protein
VTTVLPRLLNTLLEEDKDYPLYGFHYFIFRWIQLISNNNVFNNLFGDSSLVVHYLKWVGYRFGEIVQTGSNFGMAQKHHIPFLNYFGTRTMVSDGLNLVNARQSATAFRLCRINIGDDNFLGNSLVYPSTARIGDNCLIATKTLLPIEGHLRENTGLLGSPAFEIPRATGDDRDFDPFAEDKIRLQALPQKNRSNVLSMLMLLASGFSGLFMSLLLVYALVAFHPDWGVWGWMTGMMLMSTSAIGYAVLLEWAMQGFRRMRPVTMSIYDRGYWQVERYWKFNASLVNQLFIGTPFRTWILRMTGVRVGKKMFDDGVGISEKTMVTIGDYCTLNAGSVLQAHSLEQGRFKSDYIRIGNHCTLEAGAFIHYGVRIADHARVGTDAFVMKGEQLASGEFWNGNPARVMDERGH